MGDFIGFILVVMFLLHIFGVKVNLSRLSNWALKNLRTAVSDKKERVKVGPSVRYPVETGPSWPPVYAARKSIPDSERFELTVVDAVTDIVKDEPHHVMQNVTLGLKNGGSSQIDVLLFSKYGIFVIEAKAFRGLISGDIKEAKWKQSQLFGEDREFRNPIRQNRSHLYALVECIGIPMHHMHSLVIFGEYSRFETQISEDVIKLDQLKDFIRSKEPNILTEQQLAHLIGKTELARLPQCQETDDKHIEYVKTKSAAAG